MFTGIIQATGTLEQVQPFNGGKKLLVRAPQLDWRDVKLGDSIATNGVCLTVTALMPQAFWADVSSETLQLSTLAQCKMGQKVNLEKALALGERLGGHLVSGHVDGVGSVVWRRNDCNSERFRIEAPAALAKYIVHKGSITVDGVSLTVNAVEGCFFELTLVPHTLGQTLINEYKAGTVVNLEVDLIARYLERLLLGEKAAAGGITQAFLAQNGYR